MNHIIFILFMFVGISVQAQTEYQSYLPSQEGTKWELSSFNAKNKLIGKYQYELLSFIQEEGKDTYVVLAKFLNKKDKLIYETEFESTSKAGVFSISMQSKIDGNAIEAYKNFDIEIESTDLIFDFSNVEPGVMLPDATMTINIDTGLPKKFSLETICTQRKILGTETLSLAIGTYECISISQKIKTKFLGESETSTKEWYANEKGLVRSENFNKKGNMISYIELTNFETPN